MSAGIVALRKYLDVNAINLTATLHFNIHPPTFLPAVVIYGSPLSRTPLTPRPDHPRALRSRFISPVARVSPVKFYQLI